MNYWLAVGPPENWKTTFEQGNIWGLSETQKQKYIWNNLTENDLILFYITNPISGIIGYGTVQTKFRQTKPLWPQEIAERKVIWPLCFEFNVEHCLPPNKWITDKITSNALKLEARRGFHLLDSQFAQQMLSEFKLAPPGLEKVEEALSLHEQVKQKLVETGKLQGYIAEPEYPFDIGKIDVVWRKIMHSVPTYAFEVQVGGDIYHALAKLKHAFDLWNSRIFIVVSEAERNKAENLLSGTFHEISSHIKFIQLEQVEELYKRKKDYRDFERELGI